MITLTQLGGRRIVVNADMVERLEAVPDTIVTLTSGKYVIVREPVSEVAAKVENYVRRRSRSSKQE